MRPIQRLLFRTQEIADRWWFLLFLGFLAFIDVFVIVIPSDAILISSIFLRPRRWVRTTLSMTIGSFLGGALFAALIAAYGEAVLLAMLPTIEETAVWAWTHNFFQSYGLLVVFLFAASPFSFQPALFFAVVGGGPFVLILIMLALGRASKNFFIGYCARYAPNLLPKHWR